MARKSKQPAKATGSFQLFHAEITTTVNGVRVTKVIEHVHQELVNGEWVDVKPKAAKPVVSREVKQIKDGQ